MESSGGAVVDTGVGSLVTKVMEVRLWAGCGEGHCADIQERLGQRNIRIIIKPLEYILYFLAIMEGQQKL